MPENPDVGIAPTRMLHEVEGDLAHGALGVTRRFQTGGTFAHARHVASVTLLNLLLGWTGLGGVFVFFWSWSPTVRLI
jgi:hypothetical protein